MFTEVKQTSKPLPQLVSEEIEKLIVLGEFKPGDRLPSEYELAQRLGVGRSTVREATKALVSRNILEVHRGNGTFVCEQTGLVQDPLGLRFQPDKKRLGLDLCEVRLMIEPEIAALAAQKATEEEIARMQALCDAIEEKVRRNENYGALDQQLHTLWAACTRNAIMPNLVPILSQAIPLFIEACAADAVAVHSSGCCGCHSRARLRSCPAGDARASGRQSAKHRGAAG